MAFFRNANRPRAGEFGVEMTMPADANAPHSGPGLRAAVAGGIVVGKIAEIPNASERSRLDREARKRRKRGGWLGRKLRKLFRKLATRIAREVAGRLSDELRRRDQAIIEAMDLRNDRLVRQLDGLREELRKNRAFSVGDCYLYRGMDGWIVIPSEDLATLATMIESGGNFELGTRLVLQAMLRPGDTALDIGANLGAHTVVMARSVTRAGRIYAVEPNARVVESLRSTLTLGGMTEHVTIVEAAALDRDGTTRFWVERISGHSSTLPGSETVHPIEVSAVRMESVVPRGTPVTLAKIDVEGAELQTLSGMSGILEDSPDIAVIVEFGRPHLAKAGVSVEAWLGEFERRGFTAWAIDETSGMIRPAEVAELETTWSVNLLMLRHPPAHWPALKAMA